MQADNNARFPVICREPGIAPFTQRSARPHSLYQPVKRASLALFFICVSVIRQKGSMSL